jgi:hypothetical protein
MFSFMFVQVDQFGGRGYHLDGRFFHGRQIADKGNNRPVMVGIGAYV